MHGQLGAASKTAGPVADTYEKRRLAVALTVPSPRCAADSGAIDTSGCSHPAQPGSYGPGQAIDSAHRDTSSRTAAPDPLCFRQGWLGPVRKLFLCSSAVATPIGSRGPGTRATGAIGHFCPERGELRRCHLLPGSLAAAGGTPSQKGLLPAAERLSHLHPRLHALRRIWAELERAAVHAGRSRCR